MCFIQQLNNRGPHICPSTWCTTTQWMCWKRTLKVDKKQHNLRILYYSLLLIMNISKHDIDSNWRKKVQKNERRCKGYEISSVGFSIKNLCVMCYECHCTCFSPSFSIVTKMLMFQYGGTIPKAYNWIACKVKNIGSLWKTHTERG